MISASSTHTPTPSAKAAPFLSMVRIRNYKSIARCAVSLRPLSILVGRNGAGKSNFLDAMRFLADALDTTLEHAIKARGGIEAVRRRSTGHPNNFAVELDLNLSSDRIARYGFEVAARRKGGFVVKREQICHAGTGEVKAHYTIKDGQVVKSSIQNPPPVVEDRLFLVPASGLQEFRPAYDALTSMGFYNLNPEQIKELQSPDAGELLHRDGRNLASVVARLRAENPSAMDRISLYLRAIVPGITDVARVTLGPRETLEFKQQVRGAEHPWSFYAVSISDGTLRALGTLVAVTQLTRGEMPVRLVGIEEPETALHPAACAALMDALREASVHTQIVVTSHSPDLLDRTDPKGDGLLVVTAEEGNTEIAPVDSASLSAIEDHLYSAGELQRMNQLEPDRADIQQQRQIRLFDENGAIP
jgi:predicted ATPase